MLTFDDAIGIVKKNIAPGLIVYEDWGQENDKFFYVHTHFSDAPSYASMLFSVNKQTHECEQVTPFSKEEQYFIDTPYKEIGTEPVEPQPNEEDILTIYVP